MSVKHYESEDGRTLEIHATGKLTAQDYQKFVPDIERLVRENGKLKLLFEMHDFHGWEPGAVWEDLKVDVHHFNHIERIAMIGEENWQKWTSSFCKPFTTAKIRYFTHDEANAARDWLAGKTTSTEPIHPS